ncbi:Inositol-1-monophosphatase [subsurface metagenome]
MALEHRDLSRMLEAAIVAGRLAGQRAMEEINYTKSTVKNDTELVTQTDKRCQELIIERIKENYPDHGFIAEEGPSGQIFKQPPRSTEPFWWVIDPIDGTNNFAHQIRCFTVSIAAMYEGEPIVGVIFDPATESIFTAVKGGEAQLNGTRITAGQEEMNIFSSFGIDSHFGEQIPAGIREIMVRTRFRNFGTTALQFAYVASGGLVGTVAFTTKLWDVAAGILLVETAGGIVTDLSGGKIFPADLDNYNGEHFKVLAANKKVHGKALELFKS